MATAVPNGPLQHAPTADAPFANALRMDTKTHVGQMVSGDAKVVQTRDVAFVPDTSLPSRQLIVSIGVSVEPLLVTPSLWAKPTGAVATPESVETWGFRIKQLLTQPGMFVEGNVYVSDTCVVSLDPNPNCVLIPCGHCCCGVEHVGKLAACPMCRKYIQGYRQYTPPAPQAQVAA